LSQPTAQAIAGFSLAFERLIARDIGWIASRRPPRLTISWDAVAADLAEAERVVLQRLCASVLVLELNCARLLGQLVGDTPEQRHRSFLARFEDDAAWAALFEEYRDLGTRVEETRGHFRSNVLDLLVRLDADSPAIEAAGMPGPSTGKLTRMSCGQSDPHRGNNGVWSLTFGNDSRLMYKPKPLAVDAQFQRTLERLNGAIARGELDIPTLRTFAVVDCGTYGWCEHVAHAPCADRDAVERFYRREGALLAVLHIVLAVDIHQENLIASGEYPLVVDLETLFHPYVRLSKRDPTTAQSLAEDRVEESALRVGLLPWRAFASHGNSGVNLAGMGDGERQVMPFKVPRWVDIGRDDMRLERVEQAVPLSRQFAARRRCRGAVAGACERDRQFI
jgi:type 2 lantibiotic biosynthesis protein LanM